MTDRPRSSRTWIRRSSGARPTASPTGSPTTSRIPAGIRCSRRSQPGDISDALPAAAPEPGESFDAASSRDFERIMLPGITHWNHPGFFAYFAITGSAPGVLAEFLSAALNVQAMLWRTSPAATELEEVALGWLRKLIGLPDEFEGRHLRHGVDLHAARARGGARAAAPSVRTRGLAGRADMPRLRVYCSEQAHSSIDKAVILLGLGQRVAAPDRERRPSSACGPTRSTRPSRRIAPPAGCRSPSSPPSARRRPPASIRCEAIAAICQRKRSGCTSMPRTRASRRWCPGYEWILRGAERADSLVVNPHKWLFTPFDLSALYCRRMDVVRAAFSLTPEYLMTLGGGAACAT